MRKTLLFFLALLLVTVMVSFQDQSQTSDTKVGQQKAVISLGADLNTEQRNQVINYFQRATGGAAAGQARLLTVTNQEERQYLQGKVEEKVIGTRAISCAYVRSLQPGQGIDVKTKNITWVTPLMYANAATTAGLEDAQILVTAPFAVSGTAGLTGIIKAFESLTGEKIKENAKQTAHQEVAESSRLGQKIGREKAGQVISEVKRQVLEKKTTDPQEIRQIILKVTADLNVRLDSADVDRIVSLMQNLNRLNLSVSAFNKQISKIEKGLTEVKQETAEARSWLQRIFDFLSSLIKSITGTSLSPILLPGCFK